MLPTALSLCCEATEDHVVKDSFTVEGTGGLDLKLRHLADLEWMNILSLHVCAEGTHASLNLTIAVMTRWTIISKISLFTIDTGVIKATLALLPVFNDVKHDSH